jgi:hypothetical protein
VFATLTGGLGAVAQSGSAPRSHRGGQGFKSPQLHPLDLVSDQARGSFLRPQPSSLAGAFGMVGRNLGDHLLPASQCRRLLDGPAWCRWLGFWAVALTKRSQDFVEQRYGRVRMDACAGAQRVLPAGLQSVLEIIVHPLGGVGVQQPRPGLIHQNRHAPPARRLRPPVSRSAGPAHRLQTVRYSSPGARPPRHGIFNRNRPLQTARPNRLLHCRQSPGELRVGLSHRGQPPQPQHIMQLPVPAYLPGRTVIFAQELIMEPCRKYPQDLYRIIRIRLMHWLRTHITTGYQREKRRWPSGSARSASRSSMSSRITSTRRQHSRGRQPDRFPGAHAEVRGSLVYSWQFHARGLERDPIVLS